MPKVYNIKYGAVPGAYYIGRGTLFGNNYHIGRDGSREEVINKFENIQLPQLRPHLHLLKGRDLLCHCAPEACHGDILLREANK